jgi:hypothetical protein
MLPRPAFRFGDALKRRVHALGLEPTMAPRVAARVDAHLTAMLDRFWLDRERLRDRFPLELLQAEVRCATCTQVGRCRRFLAGTGEEAPASFCPNARLIGGLRCHQAGATPASWRPGRGSAEMV